MNMNVMMYEDLKDDEMLSGFLGTECTISPPAHQPVTLGSRKIWANDLMWFIARKIKTYLTHPIKFMEMKLAAKLSMRCQLRCNCWRRIRMSAIGKVVQDRHRFDTKTLLKRRIKSEGSVLLLGSGKPAETRRGARQVSSTGGAIQSLSLFRSSH